MAIVANPHLQPIQNFRHSSGVFYSDFLWFLCLSALKRMRLPGCTPRFLSFPFCPLIATQLLFEEKSTPHLLWIVNTSRLFPSYGSSSAVPNILFWEPRSFFRDKPLRNSLMRPIMVMVIFCKSHCPSRLVFVSEQSGWHCCSYTY